MPLVTLHTLNGKTTLEYTAPALLSDLLSLSHSQIDMPCGKQGKCGKCKIKSKGQLSALSASEIEALSDDEICKGIRLACCAKAVGNVEIWLENARFEEILTDFELPDVQSSCKGIGLAVDLGTTTLAAYIYDLESGSLLAINSAPNPQRRYGADVTNRLKASIDGYRKEISDCIKQAISELAGEYRSHITTAVITGNTAMLYLLAEEKVDSIAYPPFEPSTKMGISLSGDKVGLLPETEVWLPDCIGAYVGADITCAMIYAATKTEHHEKPILLADIGTNGEMALFTGDRIITCSTAAGPAFEGAGILCGMTAREGAINRVDTVDGKIQYTVIGGGTAMGICGSGLIDVVAALTQLGTVDETGRMYPTGHPLQDSMTEIEGTLAFRFESTDVFITQDDIRAVQLAKAAICGGMLTLVGEADLDCGDIKALQIAGGFGNCIRPESAAAIGLIPNALAYKVSALGNAAGAGASMMLLNGDCKSLGKQLAKSCEVIELATSKAFADNYILSMSLEPCE